MNYYYPHNQFTYVVAIIVLGFIIGIIYDLFIVKQKLIGGFKLITFVDDFLFSMISITVFLLFVFLFNNGIIRWYAVLFCLLGFTIYKKTISIPVMFVVLHIINFVRRVLFAVLRIVFYPLRYLIRIYSRFEILIYRRLIKQKIYFNLCFNRW